jgi:hypothetical protein
VDEYHGELLCFNGWFDAWFFKAKHSKWHWRVVPMKKVQLEFNPVAIIPTLYDIVY